MVDPNPARGMPLHLKRYWVSGKGAAKIRWNSPGDFLRCVRNLRKYFPEDPRGLCNRLHVAATGGPPGHGSAEHAGDAQAEALLAAAPMLGNTMWLAPLAPIGVRTGDGRMFQPGALSHRRLPLPLEWAKARIGGHSGAVTIGRIMGVSLGPDETGQEYLWGWGDLFDPDVIPEVRQAMALMEGGVAGLSLDPGGFVEIMRAGEERDFSRYRVGGATLVSIPAFEGQYILLGDGDDFADDLADLEGMAHTVSESDSAADTGFADEDCGCDQVDDPDAELSVNPSGWRGLPVAEREAAVDRDDAIRRIAAWAEADASKLNRAFLWRDDRGDPNSVYSYRLPVGDIINGKLTLIYHAIYAASALLEGAHGGLPNISGADKDRLRKVISAIYSKLAKDFDDDTIKASWDRPVKRSNGVTGQEDKAGDKGDMALTELAEEILTEAPVEVDESDALIAAAAPLHPPRAWFVGNTLKALTPITITEEGQVFGHLAGWKTCHMSVGRGRCVRAPRSQEQYSHFHLGGVLTTDGEVRVGKITMGTGHADVSMGFLPAIEHYDHTGTVVAVVRAYEDRWGIGLSGAIVPGVTPEQVAELRRSPLSGDWRGINGNLELVAALAVNVPGFPVFADGEQDEEMALVAAGTPGEECTHEHGEEGEEMADTTEVVAEVLKIIEEKDAVRRRAEQLQAMRDQVAREDQARRAAALAELGGK